MANVGPKTATGTHQGGISMHKKGPRMRTQEIEAPASSPGPLVSFLLLLVVILLSARAFAAPARGANPANAKSSQTAPAPGDFVGQETCATCHDEVAKGFSSKPALQAGRDARQDRRHVRRLPRTGQSARRRWRRHHQNLQSGQGDCQRSGRKVPELPSGPTRQLRAYGPWRRTM